MMKQLRSRFRFISLLLACAFIVTAAVCAGTALREADISLPALPGLGTAVPPEETDSLEAGESPGPEADPSEDPEADPEIERQENLPPGVTPGPDPEYNIFGL